MKKLPLLGHFTRTTGNFSSGVSEDEVRRLLVSTSRNPDESIESMRRNPTGKINFGEGTLHWENHRQVPVTVHDGGPSITPFDENADPKPVSLLVEFTLEQIHKFAPNSYEQLFDRYQELEQQGRVDEFCADLMEVLDNVAGPDITFTVRSINSEAVLGFWPTEEEA